MGTLFRFLVVLMVAIFVGVIVYTGVRSYMVPRTTPSAISPALSDISIVRPNFVIHGTLLSKVEVWAVPSGTGVTESEYTVLGAARLVSTDRGLQTWVLEIPLTPLAITGIFARGYKDQAVVGQVAVAVVGATALYEGLWGSNSRVSDITWVDSGRIFAFKKDALFTVVLDKTRYKENGLSCDPTAVITSTASTKQTTASEFSQSFQASKAGECWLTDGDFSVRIRVFDDVNGIKTYEDAAGFSVAIPVTATKLPGSDGDAFATKSIARFELARNDALASSMGTNLGEAAVLVGTAASADKVLACTKPQENETAKNDRTISGTTFSVFERHGAAAGNRYNTTSLRTVKDGVCWEIAEFVHYGVIENYDPGTARAFDALAIQKQLDAIVSSFAFSKKKTSL